MSGAERKPARDRRYYAGPKGRLARARKRGPALTSRVLALVQDTPGITSMAIARAVYGDSPAPGQRSAITVALEKLRYAKLIYCGSRWIWTCPWDPDRAPVWPR
jgi:hypothetical protein